MALLLALRRKSISIASASKQLLAPCASTVSDPVSVKRMEGTLRHQDELPKMPIPALKATMDRYLDCCLPLLETQQEKDATTTAVSNFLTDDGPSLYQRLVNYDKAETNYVETFYREIFTGATYSSYSINPNFVLFPLPGTQSCASAASKLVVASLHHYAEVKLGRYPPMNKARPLDMRQFPWIHASARIPMQGGPDALLCAIDSSRHIIAICRGKFYKIPVVAADGSVFIVDETVLEGRFHEIIEHAAALSAPAKTAVGALTTVDDRSIWERERSRLLAASQTNEENLKSIDEALLIVTLDDTVQNLSPEEMELNVLYGLPGTVENRWLDKWNIIVTGDGQAGMNWEHSMLDGHTMMEFFEPVARGILNYSENDISVAMRTEVNEIDAIVTPLEWTLDAQIEDAIEKAIDVSLSKSASCGVETLEYMDYGKGFITGNKCSPDGFAQAAMILAFYSMRQRLPVPYESVLAKAYKHGRVTVARNMSEEIAEQVLTYHDLPMELREEKQAAFRAIVVDIGRICREAANANDIDRPLLALKNIASLHGLPEPSIMADPSFSKLSDLDLCTSHCGRGPGIRFFGYEPAGDDCFSVGYYVDTNRIQFSINHFEKTQAAAFKAALTEQLDELKSILVS